MQAQNPASAARRIAVVLGTSASGHWLLDALRPLLQSRSRVELHGVLIEGEELRRAAALPFVKELCRTTLSLREFQDAQLERGIALRVRAARQAVADVASQTGASHSFRQAQGSAIGLLLDTAHAADITVFAPYRMSAAVQDSVSAPLRQPQRRIVVAIDDPEASEGILRAAASLAEGQTRRFGVILTSGSAAARGTLDRLLRQVLPAGAAQVLQLPQAGLEALAAAAREAGAGMLVLGASEPLLKPQSLRLLSDQLHCPVCLVRHWDGATWDPNRSPAGSPPET